MSDDWWGGGGESGGPSDADMRARGYEWSESGDGGGWVFTGKFPKTIAGTGSYAGDTWEAGKGYELGYLPQDFDWQKYINAPSNEDLRRAGIDTKVEAERHFALYGRSENRAGLPDWYNKELAESQKIFESGEIYNPKAGQVLGYVYELPTGERTVNKESGGKPIAIYEPPFVIDYDAKRPLTPTEKYNVVAQAAGAVDAPVEWGMGKGVLNAGYMNPKLEAAFKAPGEIQTFSNIDPTKSDWAVQSANVTLPQKSKKWYQEVLSSPVFGLGLMALGVPAGLSSALGGGIAGAAGAGALLGGAQAAATGGDFLKGALTGGAAGGFGAAAAPIVGEIVGSAGLSGAAADIAKAAAISAGKAAITGGDPLQAALAAAVGTGVGGTVGKMEALKDLDPAVAKAIVAAASGAARAAVTGGDPVRSALMGVADVGMQTALGALTGEGATAPAPKEAGAATPGPVAAEDDTVQNILRALSQQDQEQAAMQSALSSFVRPEDMQASIMEALSRQQTESDAAIAALERATGQRITAGDQDILSQLAAQEAEQRRLEATLKGEIGGLGQSFDSRVSDLMKQGQDYQTATNNALLELSASQQELGGKISGLGESFDKRLQEALAKQELSQSELESVLRGEIGGLGGTLEQRIAAASEKQQAEQRAMEQALRGEIGGLGGTLEQRIAAAAERQRAEQQAMEGALRGEISGVGSTFQRSLQEAMAQQEAAQSEMEAALRGEIGGLGGTLEQRIAAAAAQQQAEQAAMERALRGEIGGLGGTLEQRISEAAAQQQAEQEAMEQALRGEIGGLGQTFDKRLAEVLAQQEEEQAAMETALRGYDQRIVDLMRQGETEQQAMQRALEEIGIAQSKQQAATQQQIGGLGQTLGAALAGLAGEFGKTSQSMQQQIAQAQKAGQQAQQQAQFGNLLALLGMSQQQKQQQPPPVQMVGEIKPFEFSSDLLEGIYRPNTMDKYRANDQLLQMVRER